MCVEPTKRQCRPIVSKVSKPVDGQSADCARDQRMAYEDIMQRLAQYIKDSTQPEEGLACWADCEKDKQEESIDWKDLHPTPPKLDDAVAEVQDPLLEARIEVPVPVYGPHGTPGVPCRYTTHTDTVASTPPIHYIETLIFFGTFYAVPCRYTAHIDKVAGMHRHADTTPARLGHIT